MTTSGSPIDLIPRPDLEARTQAMGRRTQAEYLDGAIPYLREHEPALWATLTALDEEETLEALLAYERLFFNVRDRLDAEIWIVLAAIGKGH